MQVMTVVPCAGSVYSILICSSSQLGFWLDVSPWSKFFGRGTLLFISGCSPIQTQILIGLDIHSNPERRILNYYPTCEYEVLYPLAPSIFIFLGQRALRKRSKSNRALREHSENTPRTLKEQSESTQSIKIRVIPSEPKILRLVFKHLPFNIVEHF